MTLSMSSHISAGWLLVILDVCIRSRPHHQYSKDAVTHLFFFFTDFQHFQSQYCRICHLVWPGYLILLYLFILNGLADVVLIA